jgi:hypothetical protein
MGDGCAAAMPNVLTTTTLHPPLTSGRPLVFTEMHIVNSDAPREQSGLSYARHTGCF